MEKPALHMINETLHTRPQSTALEEVEVIGTVSCVCIDLHTFFLVLFVLFGVGRVCRPFMSRPMIHMHRPGEALLSQHSNATSSYARSCDVQIPPGEALRL